MAPFDAQKCASVKRLLVDLHDLQKPSCASLLSRIVASPDDNDVFLWHGNVLPPADSTSTIGALHFILQFGRDGSFPAKAPLIWLFQSLPHPNVCAAGPGPCGATHRLRLWDCVAGTDGWSSATRVEAILVQLQWLLCDDDLQYDHSKITPAAAAARAAAFCCPGCSHTQAAPCPAFGAVPPAAAARAHKAVLARRNGTAQDPYAPFSAPTPQAASGSKGIAVVAQPAAGSKGTASVQQPSGAGAKKVAAPPPSANGVRILHRSTSNSSIASSSGAAASTTSTSSPPSATTSSPSKPVSQGTHHQLTTATVTSSSQPNAHPGPVPCSDDVDTNGWSVVGKKGRVSAVSATTSGSLPSTRGHGTAAAESTAAPAAANMGVLDLLPPDVLRTVASQLRPAALAHLAAASPALRSACDTDDMWATLLSREYPNAGVAEGPGQAANASATAVDRKRQFLLHASNTVDEMACFFTRATFDEEGVVLCLALRMGDINPVKKVREYIEADDAVLSVHAYNVLGVRETPSKEAIHALLPLFITPEHFQRTLPHLKNALDKLTGERGSPPRQWVDVLAKVMNTCVVLLAAKGVAATQKALSTFCQVYRLLLALCQHYNLWGHVDARIASFLRDPSKVNCPHLGCVVALLCVSRRYSWRDVAGPMLNEMFTRNILWLCKHDPKLVKELDVGQPKLVERPALLAGALAASKIAFRLFMFHVGFISLVAKPDAAASGLPPGAIARPSASMPDHSCPAGASLTAAAPSAGLGPATSPATPATSQTAAKKLQQPAATSAQQAAEAAAAALERTAASLDLLYGRPGPGILARFQRFVQGALAVDSWEGFFRVVRVVPRSPAYMCAWLQASWGRSLAAGYHKRGMDFTNIQSRGVAKILLKGQQYTASPTLASVCVENRWRWRSGDGGHGHTKYLDASCMLLDSGGNLIEYIDYHNTRSALTREPGAVTHSGDIMDHADKAGLHRLTINLAALGFKVAEVHLVMSAWAGETLEAIVQPLVTVVDPALDMELCSYRMEDVPRAVQKERSAVAMCSFVRKAMASSSAGDASGGGTVDGGASGGGGAGGDASNGSKGGAQGGVRGQWVVHAHGKLGNGQADESCYRGSLLQLVQSCRADTTARKE